MVDTNTVEMRISETEIGTSATEGSEKHYSAEKVFVFDDDENVAPERIRALQALLDLPDLVSNFESLSTKVDSIRALDPDLLKKQLVTPSDKYIADIQVTTQAFHEFQAEYFIRCLSEDKLSASIDRLIGHMEIPPEYQESMSRFTQKLKANRLDFVSIYGLSIFDEKTKARMVTEPSVNVDINTKSILDPVINEAKMMEIDEYTLTRISQVLLAELLSNDSDQANTLLEQNKSEYFYLHADDQAVPARGLKLHLAVDWKEPEFLKILLAVHNAGKGNFPWKIRIYSSGLYDYKNQTLITLYPKVDDLSAYTSTDSTTNFENTMKIAHNIEGNLLNLGVDPYSMGAAVSDVAIGACGRIGLRYGELQPPVSRPYTFDYKDGWVDNRNKDLKQNLPPSVTIDIINELASKSDLEIHYR